MADMRRGGPEPASGMPEIRRTPGMADEMLKELGPLLAEEGIDLGGSGVQDMVTLQAALDRAVERRNMQLFTPVGEAREQAAHALRRVVTAISAGDSVLAADILDGVPPESPDEHAATVSGCIGVGLGLVDYWLSGHDHKVPARLGEQVRLPAGHWVGERAATAVLALSRKGRAFRSLNTLIARQGGQHVLYGSALAVGATVQRWSDLTGTSVPHLAQAHIR